MARSSRRFFLPAALAVFVVLFSTDRLTSPVHVQAVFDPAGPAFDPLSTFDTSDTPVAVPYPPRLLAGTNSHSLPASATTRNGYCIDANLDNITPVQSLQIPAEALGFRVFATDPIDPDDPAQIEVPIPTSGTYFDAAGAEVVVTGPGAASLNAGVGATSDDVYCAVVFAPEGYTELHVEWHYQVGGSGDNIVALPDIPIVTVTLDRIGNGLVGAPAEVCTVGWDSAFLTGATSNAGGLNGATPDPVNDVQETDFTVSGAFNGTVEVAYVREEGTEWCAGIGSDANEDDIQVAFDFHAVYNRVDIGLRDHDADDQPVVAPIQLAADDLVDIRDVVELRHVTIDGNVPPRQRSGPLVLNAPHYVCLMGTTPTDSLAANGITFTPVGPPDAPGASGVTVFYKSAADEPRLSDIIADGTICFTYTSGAPGEHAIQVAFTNAPPGGGPGVPDFAFFDSDFDGNGQVEGAGAGPLIAEWNRIDETRFTNGGNPDTGIITFDTVEVPLQFNLADGTYIGAFSLTEWVLGSHTTAGVLKDEQLLNGALLRATIVGGCGYFSVPDSESPTFAKPTTITGISVGGRFELNNFDSDPYSPFLGDEDASPDDINFSTLNAGDCTVGSQIRIQVEVYYPNDTDTPAAPQEWIDLNFRFNPNMKVPRVAWAGQIVTITYAISSNEDCEGDPVQFVRPDGQPGTFLPGPGVEVNGSGHAIAEFDDNCAASVRYESEEAGEVDVEAFIGGNDFSKFAFPIFFMVFEDVSLEATPDQFVSSFGDVTARVRGYFPGTNPSGRPQETKADGRTVPADRWVLPDDWEKLKGESDLRGDLGSINMPPAIVTFFMENEGVMNNYKAGVKHGAAGFFIPDDPSDFSFNVNPHTLATTLLGSVKYPRMMSQPSEDSGEASVDTFGDKNLSYEGCAANVITGNPHCQPEDITGKTRYFAVAEYPQVGNRGKHPAVASNVDETVWLWAGYKDVTIVNTDSPQIKYVVAHLRDRDGFCDAANYNNVLGVPVTFEIDAGGGVIIEAADRPYTINGTRRFATATTFDTTDALGNPINTHIARPPLIADQPDECQAWIKVSNSLMEPTNVMVTFPAPPSPIPGDIRITNLQCVGQETITVQNFGTNEVNLGGFSLESVGTDVGNAEQLDLIGILQPGESKTFFGGPAAGERGWIGASSEVFAGDSDVAILSWEDYALSTVFCSGERIDQSPLVTLPLDGEGVIKLDIVIPFGAENEVSLVPGWNMVATGEGTVSLETAFSEFLPKVEAIYIWDPVLMEWTRFIPGAPDGVNTIDEIGAGAFMWVLAKEAFTLTLPK